MYSALFSFTYSLLHKLNIHIPKVTTKGLENMLFCRNKCHSCCGESVKTKRQEKCSQGLLEFQSFSRQGYIGLKVKTTTKEWNAF